YRAVGHVNRYVGPIDHRTRTDCRQVVTIEGYVELTGRRSCAFELFDLVRYAFSQRHAPAANPDEQQILGPAIPFDDLRSKTRKRAADPRRIHHLGLQLELHSVPCEPR